jgi:NAD(P)-dependent dehydrogenase (short-subunit alcohol dehydrogenase family)
MTDTTSVPDLSGRHVLVPGGTGGVGEGAVRAYLSAGADVVVPTRSEQRAEEFRSLLGADATEHLHLVVHDYTSFAGAEALVATTVDRLGSVDDGGAPNGGGWWGKPLWEVDEADWRSAFVDLATTHLAVVRAALPRMTRQGAYAIVVGQSANAPVPGSGLVSMEQSALQMMHQVLAAELDDSKRVFLLELGPVRTRLVETDDPQQITSAQIGAVAVAASASTAAGRHLRLPGSDAATEVLAQLRQTA